MNNFTAKLISLNEIELNLNDEYANKEFCILKNNEKITFSIKSNSFNKILIILDNEFDFGSIYQISFDNNKNIFVNPCNATDFIEFDDLFYYDGNDLGAIYHKKSTKFNLWAPLAYKVILYLENDLNFFDGYEMIRTSKGVYRFEIQKNLLNKKYYYLVYNFEDGIETLDPYAKGTSLDSKYSVVVDIDKIKNIKSFNPISKINNYVDAIIYETNIRDFTEDKNTNIQNKGKYLGFVEENRKTLNENPAGLDYLKLLGFTHVQLNPVTDFANVKDIDDFSHYNWGYDPISFFCLEGSYSINPENGMSRLQEFKTMVEVLHKNDIRVVMDVVYNHVFKFEDSCFEKVVPNYYFRKTKHGDIANASGCGNDVASEKKMVRKLITDSVLYFVDIFNVDGFRFDLMGLLDIDTINSLISKAKSIKKDLIFYGEGWDMGYELPLEKKACFANYKSLPDLAFFNDTYRDIIKGPNFKDKLHIKGFGNGDFNYRYGMDYVFFASILPLSYDPKYLNANQSLNYCECHDNNTLFDKLKASNSDETTDTLLKRINLINSILLISFGIPFIHMGQEIGLSKNGNENTYNIPLINNMDWKLVDERFEMVKNLKDFISFRKMADYLKIYSPNDLKDIYEIIHTENGLYVLKSKTNKYFKENNYIYIIINVLNDNLEFDFQDNYALATSTDLANSNNYLGKVIIPGISLSIFKK